MPYLGTRSKPGMKLIRVYDIFNFYIRNHANHGCSRLYSSEQCIEMCFVKGSIELWLDIELLKKKPRKTLKIGLIKIRVNKIIKKASLFIHPSYQNNVVQILLLPPQGPLMFHAALIQVSKSHLGHSGL